MKDLQSTAIRILREFSVHVCGISSQCLFISCLEKSMKTPNPRATSSETSWSNHPGGGLGLSEATRRRAALALNATGFVVLRGASIFSDEELAMAQAVAEAELLKVKQATEKVGQTLLERAPWIQGRGWEVMLFFSNFSTEIWVQIILGQGG